MKEKKQKIIKDISYDDVKLSESLEQLDNDDVIKKIIEEREKLNYLVRDAIEHDQELNTSTIKEQKKIVEMYINEALLRKLEENIDDNDKE